MLMKELGRIPIRDIGGECCSLMVEKDLPSVGHCTRKKATRSRDFGADLGSNPVPAAYYLGTPLDLSELTLLPIKSREAQLPGKVAMRTGGMP